MKFFFFFIYRYRICQVEHFWLHPKLDLGFLYRYRRCQVEYAWLHPNLDIGNRVGSQILDQTESGMTTLDVPKLSAS